MMKKGFSLLEVLFSIAFLVMVGVAVISLNVAAVKLTSNSEIKTVAYMLNDQAISFLRTNYEADKSEDKDTFAELITDCDGGGCYLNCPVDNLSQNCSVSQTRSASQIGQSKLQYVTDIFAKKAGAVGYQIKISVSWGAGINKVESSYYLQ